jgi:signal transduction histidine kinase
MRREKKMSSTILVIDDDDLFREGICTALTFEGYEVIAASRGNSGFNLAKKRLPDLILCDVNMPDMDGYDTLRLLRSDIRTSTIPTILMTGVMKEYPQVRHGMNIGADDYITKPFSIPDLFTTIQSRLVKQEKLVTKAESKLDLLRQNITYSLPHEMRTPLTALIGYSELLQIGYKEMDREEIGTIAQMMLASSNRLHRIIEEYLDYSKIELITHDNNTRSNMRQESTAHIHNVIRTCTEPIAVETGRLQDFTLDLQPGTASISETHLIKIVSYVLENAFKFSQAGTAVSVHGIEKDNLYQLIIQDAGRGMSEEQISNIGGYMQFERKKNEQQGLGLGLITAKRLTEIYGGSFTIESVVNVGTTVTVELPVPETK